MSYWLHFRLRLNFREWSKAVDQRKDFKAINNWLRETERRVEESIFG